MKIHRVKINLPSSTHVTRLRPFADVHAFADGHDERLFDTALAEQEADKNGYCIFLGDLEDCDRPSTRERRKREFSDRPEVLSHDDKIYMSELDRTLIPKLKKIAPRCLGILDGDHYKMFESGISSVQYICLKTGIPYLGERMAGIVLTFHFWQQSIAYDILAMHGNGSAPTLGGDINRLQRDSSQWMVDMVLAGHTHKLPNAPIPMLFFPQHGNTLREKEKRLVRCGSFLRGYLPDKVSYVERNAYPPLACGWPVISIKTSRPVWNNRTLIIESVKVTA